MESPLPPPIEVKDQHQSTESDTNPKPLDLDAAAVSRQEVRISELIETDYLQFLGESLLSAPTRQEVLDIIDAALGLQSSSKPDVKKR